tara:strand:+ start:365 stop:718 length:354 start_codon:yes stop_codon:yes gene_type:complete
MNLELELLVLVVLRSVVAVAEWVATEVAEAMELAQQFLEKMTAGLVAVLILRVCHFPRQTDLRRSCGILGSVVINRERLGALFRKDGMTQRRQRSLAKRLLQGFRRLVELPEHLSHF